MIGMVNGISVAASQFSEASDSLDFSDGSGSVEEASEASDSSDQEDHGTEEGASSLQEAAPEEPSSHEAPFGEASTDTFPQSCSQQAGSCYPTRQRDNQKSGSRFSLTEHKSQSVSSHSLVRRR